MVIKNSVRNQEIAEPSCYLYTFFLKYSICLLNGLIFE